MVVFLYYQFKTASHAQNRTSSCVASTFKFGTTMTSTPFSSLLSGIRHSLGEVVAGFLVPTDVRKDYELGKVLGK